MRDTEVDWVDSGKDLENVLFQVGDKIFEMLIGDVVAQLNRVETLRKKSA